jgi:hypothetical protein
MKILESIYPSTAQKAAIFKLWNNEYPKELNFDNMRALDDYLASLSQTMHYFIETDAAEIVGWACKFSRNDEKWFAIILDEKIQGTGKGKVLLGELKRNEFLLNAWVIDRSNDLKLNGAIYKSPLKFYLHHGFDLCPEIRLENEKLSAVKITWEI